MKKVLNNNAKTKRYLDSCSKVYLIGCWAKYGFREFAFSGKFDNKKFAPLVWDYYDNNGTCDEWHLKNIFDTSSGRKIIWTFNKEDAKLISEALNARLMR